LTDLPEQALDEVPHGPFDIIFAATGACSVVFEAMETSGRNDHAVAAGREERDSGVCGSSQ
jgi:hypothetical protein